MSSARPTSIAMTAFQLAAGITFTPGEVIGPVASFTVIGVVGMAMVVVLLRAVDPKEACR
jgi:ABC-type antimicrobial peptide transport system permease subunit